MNLFDAVTMSVPQTTDYGEIQENEISALQSIFMENFEEKPLVPGAWNRRADREFSLKLKPATNVEQEEVSVTLAVSLPSTYPKTLPNCQLHFDNQLPEKIQERITAIVQTMPKRLIGSEMIYELASSILEVLEEAASSLVRLQDIPALNEERAEQVMEARQRAEKDRVQLKRDQQRAEDEEDRLLTLMVEQERFRMAKLRERSSRSLDSPTKAKNLINVAFTFDQEVRIKTKEGSAIVAFRSIANKTKYRSGPVTTVYTASPASTEGQSEDSTPSLVLKTCCLRAEKRMVQALESRLDTLLQLPSHPSVSGLLAFSIIRSSEEQTSWNINILGSYAQGCSFRDLLETITKIDVGNMRSWIIQVLEGLDFLHRHRITHARLSPENVLLERNETGTTVVKISDGGFQNDLHALKTKMSPKFSSAASAYWVAPESANESQTRSSPPKDIWDLGVLLLQMLFGLDIKSQFHSPNGLMESLSLSQSFEDMLVRIFKADPKKRPTAFELLPNEFLRDDTPILDENNSPLASGIASLSLHTPSRFMRVRRESSHATSTSSRYAKDFVEGGRLGRGGFGEVVRARNKLDGTTYAIKKISQSSTSALTGVLSEVMLLSRLNNPFIVRYYTAWIEEEGKFLASGPNSSSTSDTSSTSVTDLPNSNTQGLDFISSGGDYPKIEFGYETDEDANSEAMEDEAVENNSEQREQGPDMQGLPAPLHLQRRRSSASNSSKVTLYIQMEYCEKQTLRDLIGDLHSNYMECWRLFRQILEGLAHVHSNGVIHRDLKPENIFITLDESETPRIRIGDFGLARPGEASGRATSKSFIDPKLTASIGTSLYVAPEVRSSGGGSYNDRADMYSLGIILFEMSYPLKTAMERAKILGDLRQPDYALPSIFSESDKILQGEIIQSLVKHKPADRPGSQELLRSGRIPSQVEDETIRNFIQSLSDKASPFYTKLMNGLFLQTSDELSAKDFKYDLDLGISSRSVEYLLLQSMIKQQLTGVFCRHGAVETQRQLLFPSSRHYDYAVRLLDSSGAVMQLPYDLTLPFARHLAKQGDAIFKSYSFGNVFREAPAGVHPRTHGEVDFDIVTNDSLDLALREAEVIKVMDEIIDTIPALSSAPIVYHVTHSRLIDAILAYCGISNDATVKQIISRLNIEQWTWAKIRNELRAPSVGVASTSLEDLMRFDFREPYEHAVPKLRSLLQTGTEELESTFRHLEAVTTYLDRFSVKRKVFISPLSSVNEKFYRGNILFQCIADGKRRKVICAGGRYDRLIEELRTGPKRSRHAVGFNLAWENLLESTIRFQDAKGKRFSKKGEEDSRAVAWKTRRCDVLIDSIDPAVLRSTGIHIVQELWDNNISAELVIDSDIQESKSYQQQSKDSTISYDWIVLIKQDQTLRVRSLVRKEDVEIRYSELVAWLRGELRERDRSEGKMGIMGKLPNHAMDGVNTERDANVTVLVAQNKSKKTNRGSIVDDALARTAALNSSFLSFPIAAVELQDDIFDALHETRLSDPESWRRFIRNAPVAESQYLGQVYDHLREKAVESTSKAVWVYNFRTRGCFYYDLGKGS